MNAPAVLLKLSQQFHTLRRRHLAVRVAVGMTLALAALLLTWLGLASCDYVWELSLVSRRLALIAAVSLVGIGLTWHLFRVIQETRKQQFAAFLENVFEEFGQRIRTVLDTVDGRVEGPAVMLAALGHQALGRWETSSPSRIIPICRWLVSLAVGGLLMVIAAILVFSGGPWQTAMQRALGQDVPYTTFTVLPGNHSVLEGLPVELALELRGRINREVTLRYRTLPVMTEDAENSKPGDWVELDLSPSKDDPTRFVSQLGKASRPIEYLFVTSVGATDTFRLEVRPRIAARRVMTTVEPPSYTMLEPRTFAESEATVLERSKVDIVIETNHPLESTEIVIQGANVPSPTATASEDHRRWTFQLTATETLSWQFSGNGADGTPMTPVTGRLRVRTDQAPNLVWRNPPPELRVHTLAEIPLELIVSDDYGVREAAVVFQLGSEEEYVLAEWKVGEKEDVSPPTTRLRLEEILPLETLSLTERDYISYYAYAIDSRQPEAGRTETDVRYIDIRPLRQYFAEIETEPNNGGDGRGLLVPLDEIIRRQRFLINRSRHLTKATGEELTNQLRSIDRLMESQSELAGLTRFLGEFLISQGNDDVEALNQAEAAMLQASDSLAAASFDLALVQQEDALRALAEARRTVEIALQKNRSQQQRQAMQRFARELQQKLRRERPKSEQEVVDSLQQIAQQQQKLAKEVGELPLPSSAQAEGEASNPASVMPDHESEQTNDTAPRDVTSEATREDARERLYAQQVDLLERLRGIEDEIPDRLNSSKLLASRMSEAQDAMNSLAGQLRDDDLSGFPQRAEEISRQVAEMGIQLDALAPAEAINRVSGLRDMVSSLAQMEYSLTERLQTSSNTTANDASLSADPDEENDKLAANVRQLKRRAETIEDVIHAPADIGDAETGEISDQLHKLTEEIELAALMQQTTAAADALAAGEVESTAEGTQKHSEAAYDRTVQYAEASQALDQLYRQLVEPRLDRLRQLEQQATNLARQMNEGNSGGQEEKQEEEVTDEVKAGLAQLRQQLSAEGWEELAEVLNDNQGMQPSETEQANTIQFSPEQASPRGRLLLVIREIRAKIQELILQDILPDRDIPVPPQYQQAVDQYLRVLAGEADLIGPEGDRP